MGGDTGDAGDGTRWMTYDELAAARGINRASAIRLTFRKHWPRRTGNDGQARVAVPPDAQVPPPDNTHGGIPDSIPNATHDATGGATLDNRAMEALIRERADQAEARADRAEAQEAAARARLDQVERARDAALQERDAARQDREDARVRAASAEGETRALREALDEARRPAWQRWLGLH